MQRQKEKNITKHNIHELLEQLQKIEMHIMGIPEGKDKQKIVK